MKILATATVVDEVFQWVLDGEKTGIYRPAKDSFEEITRGDMVYSLVHEDMDVTEDGRKFLAK